MAATNAKEDKVVDDDKEVTDEDLKDLKYGAGGVETSKEEDETDKADESEKDSEEAGEDDGQTDDQAEEAESEETDETESDEEEVEFVKKFPNVKGDTLEEYARNLEAAYDNSTAEFQRLRQSKVADGDEGEEDEQETKTDDLSDPVKLYMKQKMDEEISTAFGKFSGLYSQVKSQADYAKFTRTVKTLSTTILQSEGRLAPPNELYSKAAVILGWEPDGKVDGKEKLGNAIKNRAAISKTNSSTKAAKSTSKVTDNQVKLARMMWAGSDKSDADIRKELEAHV